MQGANTTIYTDLHFLCSNMPKLFLKMENLEDLNCRMYTTTAEIEPSCKYSSFELIVMFHHISAIVSISLPSLW